MNIKTILESINIIDSINNKNINININGIAYHSNKVNKEDIFVCIKGYETDGHKYLKNAVEAGCTSAIVENFLDIDIPQYKVENSRIALASLACKFFENPSEKMNVIGITATNGKTTTSFMLNEIFEKHKLKTGLIGTVVVKIDDYKEISFLTTPESLDLQNFFDKMIKADVSHVTMEVSSSSIELNRIYGVDFDIAALNNISREHIDSHGSFENYYNFKASLITNLKPEGVAVLNLDDDYSKRLIDKTKAKTITYGVEDSSGDLSITDLDLSTGRAKFTVQLNDSSFKNYKDRSFDIALSIPGYHCVYNSLSAISIALISDIPIKTIQEGINSFKGIERRFEFIYEDDFKIIDDHFANTGNINVTLETLDFMDYNNLDLVYAIRGSRGVTVNKENAETIVKWAKKLGLTEIIATTSNSHVTKKDIVTNDELEIFLSVMKEANIKVHLFNELPDAIDSALNEAKKGDVILLAGCQGMDFGCNIAINSLEKLRPNLDKKHLREPLKYRVAGLLEGNNFES